MAYSSITNLYLSKFIRPFFIILILAVTLEAKPYRGAELRTNEAYTYGRFAVRYQSAPGAGQTSTFFTYHDGGIEWNEIDIEILGRYTDDIQFNAITPGQTNNVNHSYTEDNPHIGFHTYAFEWTPDYVAWYMDGEEVYRQTGDHVQTLNHPQKIMMNIWPPMYPGWVGELDPEILPVFAYYDWVEYASYTPGEGDIGTDNNFTHQWHDDFDSWNQTRWSKATHTWGGNNSDFTPDNVVFKDGYMILCLTDETNTGYQDQSPPTILWARGYGHQVTAKFSEPVDSTSAEIVSNYSISGITVSGVELQADGQTVVLSTSLLDETSDYSLVCFNVKDTPPGDNKLLGANVPIVMSAGMQAPVRINVGGNAQDEFLGDQLWTPEVDYGYEDGSPASLPSTSEISGTDLDAVYRDGRQGLVAYRVRLPGRKYTVRLMFSENQYTDAAWRTFDVYIEGNRVVDDLDLIEASAAKTAFDVITEGVTVRDGVLDIFFSDVHHSKPVLNGIEVLEEETSVNGHSHNLPPAFRIQPAYPNPFNASTTLTYSLGSDGSVSAEVFNLQGQSMGTVLNTPAAPGVHTMRWNATNLGSGIYLIRIQAIVEKKLYSNTQKIVLLK
ncbi:MAG: family 16 glycosylhydrolase [Candidatus Marinimicrobia bacterium]|nr:family 16 glycosylhydrolase [Candidatus Neomarinimicrobiota bacterium]MCF7829554.1 family 16 glycosylhydrolase [Candidatus Neomarinimicrobiota bacterium]MCF7882004.1 family 16 glycosylhydrolase [Candidatus Neomarinimicrobiota bacterium]